MSVHRIHRKQSVPISIDQAWEFFSNPKNLAEITPKKLNFKIISEVPEKMYEGLIIEYRVHPILSIPQTWVSEITHIKEKQYFVDEQRVGPYSMWHHEHIFHQTDSGVLMEDIIHYVVPFGPLGDLLNSLFVRNQVNAIFDYREQVLTEKFL
ncbi:MAG: SRPBCC family protein [Deltaproteobacteria bacterium]|nr:SRPBCC family protein [Deltaproteobacteria bacterium]